MAFSCLEIETTVSGGLIAYKESVAFGMNNEEYNGWGDQPKQSGSRLRTKPEDQVGEASKVESFLEHDENPNGTDKWRT